MNEIGEDEKTRMERMWWGTVMDETAEDGTGKEEKGSSTEGEWRHHTRGTSGGRHPRSAGGTARSGPV
jgi:hypothetical protein